jgi:enamine deaminase RidA (YjgF/YER057c/UK114 family)
MVWQRSLRELASKHFDMVQPNISRYRKVGNTIYTSGMTGRPGDVPTQIRNVVEKLKVTLEEAGGSLETVAKANVYLSDISFKDRYLNEIWNEYFGTHPPARTTVQAGMDTDTYVEIELVAEAKTG